MKKRALALILCALCFAPGARAVEIAFLHGWGTMEAEHIAMREIYADFQTARPDARLSLVSFPDTEQALKKAGDLLSVGEAPDILFAAGVNAEIVDFMIEKGYALNLMPYLKADAAFAACVPPTALAQWTEPDGALYTLTDVLWLSGLWLNRDILARAGVEGVPDTWEAFFSACDAIEARGGARAISITLEDAANLLQIILAGMDGEGRPAESARLADALWVLKRLYAYAGPDALSYEYRDTLSLFSAGQTAFYVNGIWAGGMIDAGVNAECAAYPGENGRVAAQVALCGYVLGNTGDEARMAASVDFVKYMLSPATQSRLLTQTGQFPANPNVDIDGAQGVPDRFLKAARAIRGADIMCATLGLYYNAAQTDALIAVLRAYFTCEITLDTACARIRAIDHR